MKSLQQYIIESSGMYTANFYNGIWDEHQMDNLEELREWVLSLSGLEYYDISRGDNTSEESNLVEWAGRHGYWWNVCYNPTYKQTPREKAIAERAKRKEVKVAFLKEAMRNNDIPFDENDYVNDAHSYRRRRIRTGKSRR